jgi:hypothetical protein
MLQLLAFDTASFNKLTDKNDDGRDDDDIAVTKT